MTLDEIARFNGFENEQEFHRLVAAVDISTPEKLARFTRWQEEDGTKEGLVRLEQEVNP